MRNFVIFVILSTIYSCNNLYVSRDEYNNVAGYFSQEIGQQSYLNELSLMYNNKRANDTAILGFVLNTTKSLNEKTIKTKIIDNLMSDWKNDSSKIYVWDYNEPRYLTTSDRGYNYNFYLSEKRLVNGKINFHYDNDTLTSIRYRMWGVEFDSLRTFLCKKFGTPKIDSSVLINNNKSRLTCWLSKDKEIQPEEMTDMIPDIIWIQYVSINKAFEREKDYFHSISYGKTNDSLHSISDSLNILEKKKLVDTALKNF